ncbi:MAG TPA: response regulator, partial [Opitutaceae bacterium]|nr:response regulator [Opitutaceae bacterium]
IIEARAIKRVIKSRVSGAELREITKTAVTETRSRRQQSLDASSTVTVKSELIRTIGLIEDEITVASACRSILLNFRDSLTATSGMAEVILDTALLQKETSLIDAGRRNKTIVSRMLGEMNAFLDGPFSASHGPGSLARVEVNAALDTLEKRFSTSAYWTTQEKSLEIISLKEPFFASIHPQQLLTALRHLIEFCLLRSPPKTRLRLTATFAIGSNREITQVSGKTLVLNRRVLVDDKAYVLFTMRTDLGTLDLELVRRLFHSDPIDARVGSLYMVGLTVSNEQGVIVVHHNDSEPSVFHLYIPVAL